MQGDVIKLIEADGTVAAQYTYNAWGEILTSSGTMAEINPLRYRGYYYDTETGFYYLQSRYYDPAMHRFINADSLASTGQGIVGTNMFAYCGSNPVNRADPTGHFWWVIAVVVVAVAAGLSGCSEEENVEPKQMLAEAPDLDIHTAQNHTYNCYGNAIGKQIVADPTGYIKGMSVEDTFKAVQNDLGGEANCVRLDSINSPVEDGWYMVAMMCGPDDYHFIRLDEGGWYNKSGSDPLVGGCYIPEEMVDQTSWRAVGVLNGQKVIFNRDIDPYYYNENGPLYFAVRIGWDD